MPRHCASVLPWCDSLRVVCCCRSSDVPVALLPESVRFAVTGFLSLPAAERFALFVDAQANKDQAAPVANGVVLLQIKVVPGARCHTATIHAIGVCGPAQDKGIASALLMRAVDLAVNHVLRECGLGGSSLAMATSLSVPPKMCVEFVLARGACLRNWDVLLLLCNHGWCVQQDGQPPMAPSDIRSNRAAATPAGGMALTIQGPVISLDGPLLYPGVERGFGLFKKPAELNAPPLMRRTQDRWDKSYAINNAVRRGTLPLSQFPATYPVPGKGLLPFTVPLLECQMLESYLEDSNNHSYDVMKDNKGETSFTHELRVGGQIVLKGYTKYSSLNGKHHPTLQSARTLKTFSEKSIRVVMEALPGCAGILQSAMTRLGHGNLSGKSLIAMVKHVHMLLLDDTSQVDFDWHEDTYDLSIQDCQRDKMLSIIVQLSATFTTSMQLHGFAYHEYSGMGSGVIFHGRAVHRSIPRIRVPPHRAVWKVAFFVDARSLFVGTDVGSASCLKRKATESPEKDQGH